MATTTRVSIDEFLAMPETEPPSELIDGEIVQKPMPNEDHGSLVAELIRLLGNYLHASGEGRVLTEVRHADRAEEWVYLPDIYVALGNRTTPRGSRGPVETIVDFAIEVLSPDDRLSRVLRRIDLYLRSGTRILWLVDPENRSITVYRRSEQPVSHYAPEVIDARPVLSGFELDLAELFAILPDED
ncbi:MAG TPA: Uma2 family endonuclease [Tepidiformaceae bacterium]|nr:Uma2 family endonuclease [Tepidiformaceae bacterium]